ncbi:MAG: isoprenylcysteine carboxylmethyltransferase family protein, partial [Mesorhizobium amorphae]
NTLLLLGIGLVLGLIAAVLVRHLAIRGEEAHLEARFGKAWRDYAKRVRRWL